MDIENRNMQYDIVKGIGIILVVLGHAIVREYSVLNNILYNLRLVIYLIHMPIFFCIAGFLYEGFSAKRKINRREYVLDKICLYIVPYLTFSILIYFIAFVGWRFEILKAIFEEVGLLFPGVIQSVIQIITYKGHLDGHLWFPPVMLIIIFLTLALERFCTLKLQVIISFVIYFFSRICLSQMEFAEVVWKVGMYYIYFCVGRLLVSFKFEGKKTLLLVLFLSCVIFRICCFDSSLSIGACLIELFIGVLSTICVLELSRELSEKKWGKGIAYIGRNSYIIYLLHQPYIVISVEKLLQMIGVPVWCNIIIATILGICVPLVANGIIIKKNKFLKFWILGKR